MNIDERSLRVICGDSKEVVVYGFGHFKYLELCEAINKLQGMKAYHSDDYVEKNEVMDKRTHYTMYNHFKYILNDLVLENYKRQLKNEPIIPLLFIVGLGDDTYDVPRIAERSDDEFAKGVTLTELRRCYKLAHEFGKGLSQVAKDTFQFVHLSSSEKGYVLTVVKPFWQDEQWQKVWQQRKATTDKKPNSEHKNLFWREKYTVLINEAQPLQNTPKTEITDKGELEEPDGASQTPKDSQSNPG
ncbi:hypothetical protein [Legionella erythra]|uniref:Uncharacterized protein n=1 Tax=Legionella erythra TaxID=448 RepID=A0A0W0TGA2_LEGER|nr:hypothetical protein [Legionella erythra]KTC94603.1 hypothetical protein Lery_2770 [Legionella erythra]